MFQNFEFQYPFFTLLISSKTLDKFGLGFRVSWIHFCVRNVTKNHIAPDTLMLLLSRILFT